MYKIAGHTMGTPEYTVFEAIELFHKIGLDGAEIVIQDGYKSGLPTECSMELLQQIKDCASANHIEIPCLTPYNSRFNALDEDVRRSEIEAIGRVIDYCKFLGARYIRIYGGNVAAGEEGDHWNEKHAKLVASMRELGDMASEKGVTLVIENHFNTMTVSARQSAETIREINHPNVKILYDQANLTFTGNEDWPEAIELQKGLVGHMHVKDLIFKGENHAFVGNDDVSHPDENSRNVITRIVGEGVIEWPRILKKMKEDGYDGWLSLEYERRWHPDDIPDASIGMKKSADYLKTIQL